MTFLLRMNWANRLTLLRIVLVPLYVLLSSLEEPSSPVATHFALYAALVFIVAAITDWADGYYARKYNRVTRFGKLVDPVADKMLVTAALLCLLEAHRISIWVALLLIGRDIAVTGLRLVALAQGEVIAASPGGKLKTTLQLTAIITALVIVAFADERKPGGILFAVRDFPPVALLVEHFAPLVGLLMAAAVVASVASAIDYGRHIARLTGE